MLAQIQRFARGVLQWFPWFRSTPLPPPPHPHPPVVVPFPVPRAKPRKRRDPSARPSVHITDVLNLLPKCRELIGPMKRMGPDLYRLWSTMGAKLAIRDDDDPVSRSMPPTFPSTGMVFIHDDIDDDRFPGIFVGWQALHSDAYWAVLAPGAEMVEVYILFTDEKGRSFGYEYLVARHGDRCWVPSQRSQSVVRLPRGGGFSRMDWGMPPGLELHFKYAKKHNKATAENSSVFGVEALAMAIGLYASKDDYQVRAERGGVSVAFNVALGRTPQFFKDRQTEVTTDGRRRRIFHSVTEHERVYPSGRVSIVPSHYRGERTFEWHGEHITITPAERSFQAKFNLVATLFGSSRKRRAGWVTLGEKAGSLRQAVEREWRKRA